MTVFALALLLNGLNPWINLSQTVAIENITKDGTTKVSNCSSHDRENSLKTFKEVNNLERMLDYVESTVNDIQLTIKGTDRKMT
jgi:hypothetical protein